MSEVQLAIATVPKQEWGELYGQQEALKNGTIFKELDKPFFAAVEITKTQKSDNFFKSQEQQEREKLMCRIMEVSFILDDLTLYLDMHEQDAQALSMFQEKSMERAQLKAEFAEKYYPLTRDCIKDAKEMSPFAWQDGPIPWEGGCI